MTFELVFKPNDIEKRPWKVFLLSVLVSVLAFFLSMKIFPAHSSILLVTFIIIPLVPVFVKIIEIEESTYAHIRKNVLKRHSAVKIFAYMFLGVVTTLTIIYIASPYAVRTHMFSEQRLSIWGPSAATLFTNAPIMNGFCNEELLSPLLVKHDLTDCKLSDFNDDGEPEYLIYTGYSSVPTYILIPETGELSEYRTRMRAHILRNNIQLLVFVFLTSFIFGSGAIFILVWNASVLGVFLGESALELAIDTGLARGVTVGIPSGLLSIFLHAIPEFTGFIISGIAGGILAVAFIRHTPCDSAFKNVVKDAVILFGVSITLIVLAAFIEVL